MQTFVPYTTNDANAWVLDNQRLGKQRVETLQILNALAGRSKGWVNHPAVRMWRGHEPALIEYGLYVCEEWISRGYKDTCFTKISLMLDEFPRSSRREPDWWGDERVHLSHQSNLLRKDPHYYSVHFAVPDNMPYHWPL